MALTNAAECACYLTVANGFKGPKPFMKQGSNPTHTQATTTLISNKYVAYTWLLFFFLPPHQIQQASLLDRVHGGVRTQ